MASFANVVMIFSTLLLIIITRVHQSESTNVSTSQTSFEETARPLPLRNHTWGTIRENNFIYIDKTPFLMKLVRNHSYYRQVILTRPPGFGKTTFLDMVEDFFRGKKDMFKGLAIEEEGNAKYWPWNVLESRKWAEFPVIRLNFREISNFNTKKEFFGNYFFLLRRIAKAYNIGDDEEKIELHELIQELCFIRRAAVVILVDDYDYPFYHAYTVLNNKKLAAKIKSLYASMFSVINTLNIEVSLAIVSGVSKVKLLKMESAGQHAFNDLTFDKDFATAFGFTESEIETNMGPYLKKWAQKRFNDRKCTEKDILDELRSWYGGYQFSEKFDACKVLNPVSTMESLREQKIGIYSTSTGSTRFLVEEFYKTNRSLSSMRNEYICYTYALQSPFDNDFNETSLKWWMLLHGYYTIYNSYGVGGWPFHSMSISLEFPNREIGVAIEYNLAMYLPDENKFIHEDYSKELAELGEAISNGNTEKAVSILSIFAFRSYEEPWLEDDVSERTMARRLVYIFHTASINVSAFIAARDTSIQTRDLKMNYIIEVQITDDDNETALPIIEKLLEYFEDNPNFFEYKIRNQTNFYYLGLNFVCHELSAKLNSWIVLPFANGVPQYSDVVAQPGDLKQRLLENYSPHSVSSPISIP